MIWAQSLNGKAIDLVTPRADQVDFKEIADTLAGVYRWAGTAELDVSVAAHTLIAFDAAPLEVKPYVLLHDAHEARIGDITRPVQQALETIAGELCGESGYHLMRKAFVLLKLRHDRAIYHAAGLPFPSPEILGAVKLADNCALMTERRDFLRPPPMPWARDLEAVTPLPHRYRWKSKWVLADELYPKFLQYLPVFQTALPVNGGRHD